MDRFNSLPSSRWTSFSSGKSNSPSDKGKEAFISQYVVFWSLVQIQLTCVLHKVCPLPSKESLRLAMVLLVAIIPLLRRCVWRRRRRARKNRREIRTQYPRDVRRPSGQLDRSSMPCRRISCIPLESPSVRFHRINSCHPLSTHRARLTWPRILSNPKLAFPEPIQCRQHLQRMTFLTRVDLPRICQRVVNQRWTLNLIRSMIHSQSTTRDREQRFWIRQTISIRTKNPRTMTNRNLIVPVLHQRSERDRDATRRRSQYASFISKGVWKLSSLVHCPAHVSVVHVHLTSPITHVSSQSIHRGRLFWQCAYGHLWRFTSADQVRSGYKTVAVSDAWKKIWSLSHRFLSILFLLISIVIDSWRGNSPFQRKINFTHTFVMVNFKPGVRTEKQIDLERRECSSRFYMAEISSLLEITIYFRRCGSWNSNRAMLATTDRWQTRIDRFPMPGHSFCSDARCRSILNDRWLFSLNHTWTHPWSVSSSPVLIFAFNRKKSCRNKGDRIGWSPHGKHLILGRATLWDRPW